MTGKDVRKLRLKLGMNQTNFGKLFKYTDPQIRVSRIETTKRELNPRLSQLIELVVENILKDGN